ncbi:hypothetical protein XH98_08205 [Bradyrhizobium sp. CCBAU 51745]|nr:hypothetical protein [Bradyrhizobium sp. CCBAU 45384]MDA9439093.1 hypothetical protein [Bradyrhizobium sp. CCBAU 51745]
MLEDIKARAGMLPARFLVEPPRIAGAATGLDRATIADAGSARQAMGFARAKAILGRRGSFAR